MTLLHTNYASGALFTAGTTGGTTGASGINDISNRVNFANYNYPQAGSMNFTYTAGRISQVVYSGADSIYQTDVVYDGGFVGSAVTSGATIGSIITIELYNNGTQFVSGITKLE